MTPPPPPQTWIGKATRQATQLIQKAAGRLPLSQVMLNPQAKPPRLRVYDADHPEGKDYPLVGEYHAVGRSSRQCDITVTSEIASQTHLVVMRDRQAWIPTFIAEDRQSTNGLYWRKRRINGAVMGHQTTLSLGPPDLANVARVQYLAPPPWSWLGQTLRYGGMAVGGAIALAVAALVVEWQKVPVVPLPVVVRGPVQVIAGDGQTQVQPKRTTAHREFRRLSDFSSYLPEALLASEDARFYWHFGVDPIGTARALFVNVTEGAIQQGGSTLTQQLARSLFRDYVGTQNSAQRKLREAVMALKLETVYSKDFLLLTYLNQVFLGGDLYGFEDAAQFYFAKSAQDLDLSEAATLVGILPAPNVFNPVQNYERAITRRNLVINRMLSQGSISLQEANQARRSRLQINPAAIEQLRSNRAPYFYNYVMQELEILLGSALAREGNFYIETSLNLTQQAASDRALQQAIATDGPRYGYEQGAIVTLDTRTSAILAMSGGADYATSQFNRAAQALRQPGSTFKVFAYTAALAAGISPNTTYSCAPLTWQGQRYRGCRSGGGNLNFYSGVAQSENPIALRVAQDVGLDRVVAIARALGITTELRKSPGLILGESETTVLEMTGAYATLANDGTHNRPHAIRRILDSSDCTNPDDPQTCRLIYDFAQDEPPRPVLDPAVAQTMTTLLRGAVTNGTARNANTVSGAVGKTGTTDDNVDLWFVGYVPNRHLAAGVWLGNDNPTPTRGSSAQAATVWGQYLRQILP